MNFNDLKLGNKIIIKNNNSTQIAFFECILDDEKILFQNVLPYCGEYNLKIGNTYEFLFITDFCEVKYNCKILNYIDEGRRRLYLAKPFDKISEETNLIQRRKNTRFYCNLPYYIRIFKKEQIKDINCIIKDIGFGGVRFLSNFELKIDDKIEIDFNKNNDFFFSKGTIIECQNYPKSNYKNQYRVRFLEVDFSDKDFFKKYFHI